MNLPGEFFKQKKFVDDTFNATEIYRKLREAAEGEQEKHKRDGSVG